MEEGFEKKALLAIVLSLLVLLGYQYFFAPPPPPPPTEKVAKTEQEQKTVSAEKPLLKENEKAILPATPDDGKEREITVETPLYKAVLSTRGATIKLWQLKKYLDDNGEEVFLQRPDRRVPALAIGFNDEFSLGRVNFALVNQIDSIVLNSADQKETITFVYHSGDLLVKRTYTFYGNDYRVDVKEMVQGRNNYWLTLGTGFGISGAGGYGGHTGPVILKDADRIEIKPDKLKTPEVYSEGLRWVAQEDKYFFASIVPLKEATAKVYRADSSDVIVALNLPAGENSYILYVGPKEHDRLKQLGVGLEYIVDFGFFSIIARPIFWILKQLYKLTGNYGWAIILLTIILRIPFIPLISKGQKSMKKLQALQPKMNEIRQKYKKDPQRMQKEMMELYKKYKVNPMSGCLPMLVQIPVFFALYKVLLIAIELRGAPFMLWIKDLSEKDPYYILPIVMGITMYIQQKMTPSTADTQQQKIMNYLPIIFTFLFLNFPSGLVLYWLVSNILSIIQQYYVNRKLAASQQ